MRKINIMLHTEVVECLRPLDDETLAKIMRMIFDWNDGIEVEPITQVEKFAWALVLPKLEQNKKTYQNIVDRNRKNGLSGGAPVGNQNARKQPKTTMELTTENNPKQTNYNYNNTSKEVLCIDEVERDLQPEPLDGGSVGTEETTVSKGLETLENAFPQRKRDIGISEINLWNSLTQPQKANLIKKAVLYVRSESKNQDGKFIKKMSKWMSEEIGKGISEELLPKKNSNAQRTFKYTDGNIFSLLEQKIGSTKESEHVYHTLNNYGLTKEEFYSLVKEQTKEELLTLK
jgi:hypothetical protein